MTIKAYPFETQDTTETEYNRILRETQDDGVAASQGAPDLLPTPAGGSMVLNVPNGILWAGGRVLEVSGGTETVTVPAADATARVDLVVGRLDALNNNGLVAVKRGTPGSSTPPALTQTDNVWEVELATVAVAGGATSITAANITDRRRFVSGRLGLWTTALRPSSPRRWQVGLNLTTGRYERFNHTLNAGVGDWEGLGKGLAIADMVAPSYNLLDGKTLSMGDNPPAANFGKDYDIHLEY